MNNEIVVTDWDVAQRHSLVKSPAHVAEQQAANSFFRRIVDRFPPRVCISCGAHTNIYGALPCGH